jgi:hypothetical protein
MVLEERSNRLSLVEACRTVGVHYSTLARWLTCGVRGRKLESYLVGGRRFVNRVDLEMFVQSESSSNSKSIKARHRVAQQELIALGLLKPEPQKASGKVLVQTNSACARTQE